MTQELRINPILMAVAAAVGMFSTYAHFVSADVVFSGGLETNLVLLTIVTFVLSMMFFGYLTIPLMFLFGMAIGPTVNLHPIYIVQIIPILMAGYGGGMGGTYIRHDMNKLFDFYTQKTEIVGFLIASIVVAVIVELIGPFIAA